MNRTIYISRSGRATHCVYRAAMVAQFEAQAVSLPVPPRKTFTPPSAAPAVPVVML